MIRDAIMQALYMSVKAFILAERDCPIGGNHV
jgi:hypothetical protein